MFAAPSKCIPSVTKTSLVLHLLGSLWYMFGVYHERVYYYVPHYDGFGGRFKFLTVISMYLTLAASIYAFAVDLIQITTNSLQPDVEMTKRGYPKNSSSFIGFRDELISCWVYIGCTIVPILYWGIYIFDRNGIHSDELEKICPLLGWYNQFKHSVPMLYAFLLISFVNYEYCSVTRVLVNTSIFIIGYVSWMACCAKMNGYWPYPILQKFTAVQFVLFIGICILVVMILQIIGRKISSCIWSEKRRENTIMEVEAKYR